MIHYWADGSGMRKINSKRLDVWDSGNVTWHFEFRTDTARDNAYRIATEFTFTDHVDTLIGHYIGHEDGEDGYGEIEDFEMWELAYGLTYAGHGLEDVSWRRLDELLHEYTIEETFSILGVSLAPFTAPSPISR